jgi:hypothetical protein
MVGTAERYRLQYSSYIDFLPLGIDCIIILNTPV